MCNLRGEAADGECSSWHCCRSGGWARSGTSDNPCFMPVVCADSPLPSPPLLTTPPRLTGAVSTASLSRLLVLRWRGGGWTSWRRLWAAPPTPQPHWPTHCACASSWSSTGTSGSRWVGGAVCVCGVMCVWGGGERCVCVQMGVCEVGGYRAFGCCAKMPHCHTLSRLVKRHEWRV